MRCPPWLSEAGVTVPWLDLILTDYVLLMTQAPSGESLPGPRSTGLKQRRSLSLGRRYKIFKSLSYCKFLQPPTHILCLDS